MLNEYVEYPEIKPLESLDEYKELSQEELAVRQAAVTDYFVTFAINYSKRVRTSTDYLLHEVDEYKSIGNYSASEDSYKSKEVTLARKLVEGDSLCGTVLDRMVSFCITSGNIENVKDKEFLNSLNMWKKSVNNLNKGYGSNEVFVVKPHGIPIVFSQIVERLLTDGDAVISEVWAEDVDLFGKKLELPYKINIHDTLLIDIDDEEFSTTGRERMYINTTGSLRQSLTPKKGKAITPTPLFSSTGDPFTTHLKLRPKTFSKWGTSYFKRAFSPVASKKRIEALEVNTIEGLINRLTIIKAGKIDAETESGIVAPHRLAVLERLISQPKTNNLILWPGDDITVEDIGPKEELLTYEKKYAESNEQILASLGFPRVLIDGEGSSTENWQKFLGLISYLDNIRNNLLVPWINNLLRKIAVRNGYEDEYPSFSFSRLKLYDLKEMLNAVKVFYDRGLMSELSAITSGDLSYEVELSRREVESEDGIVTKFGGPKALPFSKNTEGGGKEGKDNPDRTIDDVDKEDKAAASIRNENREELISVFNEYLSALHDNYTRELVASLERKSYNNVAPLFLAYLEQIKRDIRDQMRTLFSEEVAGKQLNKELLTAALVWINSFVDPLIKDMEDEVQAVIENNKEHRQSIIPDLVAGIMATFGTKRIRLYSSSVYNKARAAGELTENIAQGFDYMIWKSALTEKTCEYCGGMHDKGMSALEFFENFPPHPNCECWGEKAKEYQIDEDILPKKDPNNWSNILS